MTEQGTEFLLVIDTDEYAGNFEREMCAYLTGQVGECGVGGEYAELFHQEVPTKVAESFENIVAFVTDEHSCARPATIWANPRYGNDGFGNHYLRTNRDDPALLATYAQNIANYEQPHIESYQRIKDDLTAGWTVVAGAEQSLVRANKRIADAKALKKIACFPAYMSVGIWLTKKPTAAQISLLKERTAKFAEAKRKLKPGLYKDFTLTIEGFRLITFKKTAEEQTV
jgi:hypothetical protein